MKWRNRKVPQLENEIRIYKTYDTASLKITFYLCTSVYTWNVAWNWRWLQNRDDRVASRYSHHALVHSSPLDLSNIISLFVSETNGFANSEERPNRLLARWLSLFMRESVIPTCTLSLWRSHARDFAAESRAQLYKPKSKSVSFISMEAVGNVALSVLVSRPTHQTSED